MSYLPCADPEQSDKDCGSAVDLVILPRTSDIGGFNVHRSLPFKDKRLVGPFIFWDQMGPGEFITGQGLDVRPHPHIGLSTVTYLFSGSMDHKDSLGNDLRITPGELNLMTAGKGIVHSERTGLDVRQSPSDLFGIQSWMALPKNQEFNDPSFSHLTKDELPLFSDKGVNGRVILGNFHGVQSPAQLHWDTLYIDLELEAGSPLNIPSTSEERALYVVSGQLEIEGHTYPSQHMIVLKEGRTIDIKATEQTRCMILGGAAMDGPRYIWWNFVASSKERLEEAKALWKADQFPKIPTDNQEFIPLPDM